MLTHETYTLMYVNYSLIKLEGKKKKKNSSLGIFLSLDSLWANSLSPGTRGMPEQEINILCLLIYLQSHCKDS